MRLSKIEKLAIIALFFPLLAWAGEISSKIASIPIKDREILERFFKQLVSQETFGYVIFGDKPIAITGFLEINQPATKISLHKKVSHFTRKQLLTPFLQLNSYNLDRYQGFRTWAKYSYTFPMQNYLILECENLIPNDYHCIMIINKKAFLETVERHIEEFRKIMGQQITPEFLLEQFRTQTNIFRSVLKSQETLIGILFGFGEHNAKLYDERDKLLRQSFVKIEDCPQKLHSFYNSNLSLNHLGLGLPRFAADLDHFETKALKQKYLLQRQKILKRYESEHFLETTLERLCENSS